MSWLSRLWPAKKRGGTSSRGRRARSGTRSTGLLRRWLMRGVLSVLIVCLVVWASTWLWASGLVHRAGDRLAGFYYKTTADLGLRVEAVLVEGRHYTDADALRAVLNLQTGDPILAFDPEGARDLVEQLNWVRHARVERRLPDTIFVDLTERRPMAFLRENDRTVLIDETGAVLAEDGLQAFAGLITISGDGAVRAAPEFLALLEAEPELRARVASARYIGKRRWDLRMDNGLVVRLPEEGVPLALSTLAERQEKDNLLDKDAVIVDLRQLPEKFLIQTTGKNGKDRQAERD